MLRDAHADWRKYRVAWLQFVIVGGAVVRNGGNESAARFFENNHSGYPDIAVMAISTGPFLMET